MNVFTFFLNDVFDVLVASVNPFLLLAKITKLKLFYQRLHLKFFYYSLLLMIFLKKNKIIKNIKILNQISKNYFFKSKFQKLI